MLPIVLTVDPSARVTTRCSLAAVGVRSASCLAIAYSKVGEQTTSVNKTVDGNREMGWPQELRYPILWGRAQDHPG